MYIANRPGRINERRIRALSRIGKKTNREAAEVEAANLRARIISQAQAEAIRTKKDRSARGKFRRNA